MAGMKLRDVAKGTWAVKAVPLLLANAAEAPVPGQPPSTAPVTIKVGVRVLLGEETAKVLEKAQAYALEKGVPEWKDDHPLCSLYKMAFSCLFAVCSVDPITGEPDQTGDLPEPFFDSVEQMFESKRIGTDNIAYLHDQWVRWEDERSFRGNKKLTLEEAVNAVLVDMEAPDSPESPLLFMGHALLVSCVRHMGNLYVSSLMGKSPSTLRDAGVTT